MMASMTGCQECGFDYASIKQAEVPAGIAAIGPMFAERVRGTQPELLRRRPKPWVWSALEYACHTRDVLLVQRDRLYIALVEDTPTFAKMHRDERVALARYNDQDPGEVADQLEFAAAMAGQAFGALEFGHWLRPLIYTYPAPRKETILFLGRHTIHEGRHHLGDFDRSTGLGGPAS
jgi:S-DNA-T family DNA segregation ATPase FtsK/SpoIIIE